MTRASASSCPTLPLAAVLVAGALGVVPACGGAVETSAETAAPTGLIRGKVTLLTGNLNGRGRTDEAPIVAEVRAYPSGATYEVGSSRAPIATARSETNGVYQLAVSEGTYSVLIFYAGRLYPRWSDDAATRVIVRGATPIVRDLQVDQRVY